MNTTEIDDNDEASSKIAYPRFAKRLQAALFDYAVFLSLLFFFVSVLSEFEISGVLKGALFVLSVILLEPGLVCLTGGTIGHHTLGLRIQDQRTGNNLNPFFAFVRFLLKLILGWLSFIFILMTKQHQAIHDILGRSVVIIRNPKGKEGKGELPERQIYLAEFAYPAWYQRVFVIVFFIVCLIILQTIVLFLLFSEACLFAEQRCSKTENLFEFLNSIIFLVASLGSGPIN